MAYWRSPKSRRSDVRASFWLPVVLLAGATLLILASWVLMRPPTPESQGASSWQDALDFGKRALYLHDRLSSQGPVIYPYSVIPGGVHSLEELKEAIARDPVVARAYANFNLLNFHTITLKKNEYAYVSFRFGNKIFWTRKKVKLCKGETLLTDGVHYARTRCGNAVSQVPHAQTWSQEPPESLLDTPASPPQEPVRTEAFFALNPETSGQVPSPGGVSESAPLPTASTFVTPTTTPPAVPFFGPLIPPTIPTSNKVPRPSPVPEDGTFLMIVTGLASLAMLSLHLKKGFGHES